jgi:acyl-CoA thioesterase superfamily protein
VNPADHAVHHDAADACPGEGAGSTAFFRVEGDLLVPLPRATSGWGGPDGGGQLRGTAVSGALARAAEHVADGLDGAERFRPVRWTLDLFRPGAMVPCTTVATVVRGGRRLRLIDVEFVQDGAAIARANLLLLATGGPSSGTAWTGPLPDGPPVPPADLSPDPAEPTLYRSDAGWSADATAHANDSRKAVWFPAAPVVEGEDPSPFVHVAVLADAANLTTSWGTPRRRVHQRRRHAHPVPPARARRRCGTGRHLTRRGRRPGHGHHDAVRPARAAGQRRRLDPRQRRPRGGPRPRESV